VSADVTRQFSGEFRQDIDKAKLQEAEELVNCPQCGAGCVAKSKYCANCGAELAASARRANT
ncbi:MAG: hypothetical protein ABIH46_00225, partial [Chloroflexota bacterium]